MEASGWCAGLCATLRARPYTLTSVFLLIVVAVSFLKRRDSEWESVYLPAADRLWRGADLYPEGTTYLYPPFMAFAALPFLCLKSPWVRLAWLAVNCCCGMAMFRCAWRAAGGGRLEGAQASQREHYAAIIGTLCGISYVQNCLGHQQTDLVIGALVAGGCLMLTRGSMFIAATSLGLAAAMKCTPLLFAPYLLWHRRPLAAAWLVTVAVGANLMADTVTPAPGGATWLGRYGHRFLIGLAAPDRYVGTWGSDPAYNQSLTGAIHRWSLTTWTWTDDDCLIGPRDSLPSPASVRWLAYGGSLALLAAALWAAGGPGKRVAELKGEDRTGLECSVVVLLMLLLSPMSSPAHFGILVLPAFCLARVAGARGDRACWTLLLGALAMLLTMNKDPMGERLYTLSLWFGATMFACLALLGGCLLSLRRPLSSASHVAASDPLRVAA